jgi:hypothetical protein
LSKILTARLRDCDRKRRRSQTYDLEIDFRAIEKI